MSEAECGLEVYLTGTPGVGGRIKAAPEDFVVEEVASPPPPDDAGRYTIATVRTRNWETNRLVRQLARELRVSRKRIAFAGTKDKRAVATRLLSFDLPPHALGPLRLADVEILDTYRSARPLEIGDLRGNRFRIVVRGMAVAGDEARARIEATLAALRAAGGFPGFFGIQRFGALRPVTHRVGRHLVRGEFREAVDAYVANPVEGEDEESFAARGALQESGDYRAALRDLPDRLGFEKAVLNRLAQRPGDFADALQALPFNLLLLFVHAYQSFLFNRILSERIRRGLPLNEPAEGDLLLPRNAAGLVDRDRWVPVTPANLEKVRAQCLAGKAFVSGAVFGSESPLASGAMGEIERAVLDGEGVRAEDFVVPRIPRLTTRGTRRELLVPLESLAWEVDGDSASFAFALPRGAYATAFLREVLKDERGLS